MRILPKQFYLQLETVTISDDPEHTIRFTDSLASVLRSWTASTRISPVWRLRSDLWDGARRNHAPEQYEFIFVAATNPSWLVENLSTEALRELGPEDLWLTVGAYNLIIRCLTSDLSDEIADKAERARKPIERWHVNGALDGKPRVEFVQPIGPFDTSDTADPNEKPASALAFEKAEIPDDDTLSFMILEMYALTSVVETRSVQNNYPNLKSDALGVQEEVAKLLPTGSPDIEDNEQISHLKKQNLLLSLNAGLSRMASQALSGTTPITQTECHFWPHSMLGTGVANYALRNVTQFLTDAVVKNRYHIHFEANLKRRLEYPDSALPDKGKWEFIHTEYQNLTNRFFAEYTGLDIDVEKEEVEPGLDMAPNPITFFSGRDGFKNTLLTTSAPLMSVAGANCVRWNLGTISHEISHRIISGKLERIFKILEERFNNFSTYEEITAFLRSEPDTIGDLAERFISMYLANRVWESKYSQSTEEVKARFASLMAAATRIFSRETEELLVHIFDFYHFYGGDDEQYVKFVWHSWAVQPSIVEKLDDYILRTVLALAAERFESNDCINLALGDFERICGTPGFKERLLPYLNLLETKMGDNTYKDNLLAQAKRSGFLLSAFFIAFRQVKLREFSTHDSFFDPSTQSERISAELLSVDEDDCSVAADDSPMSLSGGTGSDERVIADEAIELGKRKYKSVQYNYNARKRYFYNSNENLVEGCFQNPLAFLRDFSRDEEPDASKSAWLHTILAFNWTRSEPQDEL